MANTNQRAIELYNSIQKKEEELKQAKKEFKDLHKAILKERVANLQKNHPEVDLTPHFSGEEVCAKFVLPNGWLHYFLVVNSAGKSIDCIAYIDSKDFTAQSSEQFLELVNNFKGIFSYYYEREKMFTSFLPYEYDEVFDCFTKAFDKFAEIGVVVESK